MTYTERVDGFQIRDVSYWGKPPEDAPIRYDIVKWVQHEPQTANIVSFDENGCASVTVGISTEYCYSVGFLEWRNGGDGFRFESVGTRWLEEKPSEAVIDMVLKFCEEKEKEIEDKEGWC